MPGVDLPYVANDPQVTRFDADFNFFTGSLSLIDGVDGQPLGGLISGVKWFRADGIPILPVDDQGRGNAYPLVRVQALQGGVPVASTDVVLPVAAEADCQGCHLDPNTLCTSLGLSCDGIAASSGQGSPANTFPVNNPLGLACDSFGNVYVTSTSTVRLLPADDSHVVDGTGPVQTIFGAPPRDTFPASVANCLTGIAVVDDETVQVVDSCTGILVELRREAVP